MLDGGDDKADEHAVLFFLELVTRITVANRDRVGIIWRSVADHMARLIAASAGNVETIFQVRRKDIFIYQLFLFAFLACHL